MLHFTWVHFGQVKKEELILCKQMSSSCVSGPGRSWFSWISSLNYQANFTPRCTITSPGSRKRADSLSLSLQGNIAKTPSNNGAKAASPWAGLPWSPGSPWISMSWARKRKETVPTLTAHTIQEDWPNETYDRRAILSSIWFILFFIQPRCLAFLSCNE